jgi:hypothetical protein
MTSDELARTTLFFCLQKRGQGVSKKEGVISMQTMTHKPKKLLAEQALLARINRRLRPKGKMVRKCPKHSPIYYELGDYYLLDSGMNLLLRSDVNLIELGRDLGVLKARDKAWISAGRSSQARAAVAR